MRIKEIDNYEDFLGLKESWHDLLQKCDHTVFSTWEWLSTWWKHFGNDKRPILLLAEENGKIHGIAPLMYSVHKMFGLRKGIIEFMGTPDSDYQDFILTDRKEECIRGFVNHLENLADKWDFIDLADIPQQSKSLPVLAEMSKTLKPVCKCPYLSLPASYETFLMSLTRNQRKNIYNTKRRLDLAYGVEYVDCSGPDFSEGMQSLVQLHQKRWETRGFPGALANQQVRNFHLEVAKLFSQKKWLNLFVLRLSSEPVSVLYGFKYRSKFYEYLSGLEPRYSRYSVGNLLRAHVIERLIQEGIVELDFLRGAEEYKSRWTETYRWNQEATIIKRGFFESFEYWLSKEYWDQTSGFIRVVKNAPKTLARVLNK